MAIAGTMACMMWGGEAYYALPEKYTGVQYTTGFKEKKILPRYRIDTPSKAIIECISFVEGKGPNGASKKAIIQHLKKEGLLKVQPEEKDETANVPLPNGAVIDKTDKGPSRQAEYKSLEDHILRPAREVWKYTTETGNGRSRRIRVTEDGRAAIRVFGVAKKK